MNQAQLSRDQPEERAQFDSRHEFNDLGTRLKKQKVREPRPVRANDELCALEQQDLIDDTLAFEIHSLEIVSRQKDLHLLNVVNFPRRPSPRDKQSSVSWLTHAGVARSDPALKVLHVRSRHGLDEIAVYPDGLFHLNEILFDLHDIVSFEADRPERLAMV